MKFGSSSGTDKVDCISNQLYLVWRHEELSPV